MKLARIDHNRCDEIQGVTLVWVDDDMTQEELQDKVDEASKRYLDQVTDYLDAEKPPFPGSQPNWEKHKDALVGEVLHAFESKKAVYKTWEKKRDKARKAYDRVLCEEEGIYPFWDHEFDIEAEVYWGHMHGTHIEFGETEIPHFSLMKSVRKTKPGGQVTQVYDEDEWA